MTKTSELPIEQRRDIWRTMAEFWRGRNVKLYNLYSHYADGTLDTSRELQSKVHVGNNMGHRGGSRTGDKVEETDA